MELPHILQYLGKKYCSWCCTRKINPNSATLNQVADFLSDLFNEGLQYRTIAGYRSMLSAVLPHYENVTIGQHPHIIREIVRDLHTNVSLAIVVQLI
jgi:hypothetical protein